MAAAKPATKLTALRIPVHGAKLHQLLSEDGAAIIGALTDQQREELLELVPMLNKADGKALAEAVKEAPPYVAPKAAKVEHHEGKEKHR